MQVEWGGRRKQTPLWHGQESGGVHCLLLHKMPAWAVKETAMLLNREWPRSISARMQSIQARCPSLSVLGRRFTTWQRDYWCGAIGELPRAAAVVSCA